ncbi:hypothetical protein V2G26_020757 [Clonostachys chloroleuca]
MGNNQALDFPSQQPGKGVGGVKADGPPCLSLPMPRRQNSSSDMVDTSCCYPTCLRQQQVGQRHHPSSQAHSLAGSGETARIAESVRYDCSAAIHVGFTKSVAHPKSL